MLFLDATEMAHRRFTRNLMNPRECIKLFYLPCFKIMALSALNHWWWVWWALPYTIYLFPILHINSTQLCIQLNHNNYGVPCVKLLNLFPEVEPRKTPQKHHNPFKRKKIVRLHYSPYNQMHNYPWKLHLSAYQGLEYWSLLTNSFLIARKHCLKHADHGFPLVLTYWVSNKH